MRDFRSELSNLCKTKVKGSRYEPAQSKRKKVMQRALKLIVSTYPRFTYQAVHLCKLLSPTAQKS